MEFPSVSEKQGFESVHDQSWYQIDQDRHPGRVICMTFCLRHHEEIVQKTGDEGQSKHQWKREREASVKIKRRRKQYGRPAEDQHWGKKKLKDERPEDQNDESNEKGDHFWRIITNTSQISARSTAGVTVAIPSNSFAEKSLTVPITSPDGKTPPAPAVRTFIPGCNFAVLFKKRIFRSGV